jgi:transposase
MKQVKSYNPNQTYFIAFNPFEKFKPGSLEMTINNIIEKYISIKPFLEQMNNKCKGQKAISPKILLKVIFYAYCCGIFSSRTIEEYLSNHLSFIFLADYNNIDHSTICRFINKYPKQIQQIFSKVLYICYKNKLVNLDMISIDGSKIRANAHSEWTGNKKEFLKLKEKLEQRIEKLIERQKRIDKQESDPGNLIKYKNKIERQKKKYQSAITKIDKFMDAVNTEEKKVKTNLTDPDCRLQKGENGKYFEGYNAQVVANEKIIISYDINNHQSDRNELLTMMELTEKKLTHLGIRENKIRDSKVLADAGYRNNDHIGKLNIKGYDMYIRVNPKKK